MSEKNRHGSPSRPGGSGSAGSYAKEEGRARERCERGSVSRPSVGWRTPTLTALSINQVVSPKGCGPGLRQENPRKSKPEFLGFPWIPLDLNLDFLGFSSANRDFSMA